MKVITNLFTNDELGLLRGLPEVSDAQELLSRQSVVYFSVPLPDSIKQSLMDAFGINLSGINQIPCRWIKGDTAAHVDRGVSSFEDTYLVYLTNGDGEFHLGEESYPIVAGSGFSFSEGVSHEVVHTNGTTRLLLGPMSEQGFAVGISGLYADGETSTAYLKQESGNLYAKINEGDWVIYSFPLAISNTNANPSTNILKVLFTTNFTLSNTNEYFQPISDGIQFGSRSLNTDQSRPVVTIDVASYDGLIQNGDELNTGHSSIYVYNLVVDGGSYSPQIGAGWIGKAYFGNGATNNYFVNCSSSGDLPDGVIGSGGIVGSYAGNGSGAQLYLYGCSSSGSMGQLDGGIVGGRAGKAGGSVTCEQCYSTGTIGSFAGGIFGDYAGDGGSATATKCYTTGTIGTNGGGIFGRYGGNNGTAVGSKCYSQGTIAGDGGGIFGSSAASNAGSAVATNCYSTGTIATSGNGIYGTSKGVGATTTNCYSANNSWSDVTANANLAGVPSGTTVGTVWIQTATTTPYELNGVGYTPYTIDIINASSQLIQTYSQTIQAGEATVEALAADASGNEFVILLESGGDSVSYASITMSVQTGAISTTSATVPGTYTITLRSVGSYHITTFVLTISPDAISDPSGTACCVSSTDERGLDYAQINDYRIGNRLLLEVSQNSKTKFDGYSQYVKYKMAQGSRKV